MAKAREGSEARAELGGHAFNAFSYLRCAMAKVAASKPDRSSEFPAFFGKQLAQERAMTPRFILAVAAHREVRRLRERREKPDETLRVRLAHLAQIVALIAGPALQVPRFGQRPRNEV